MSYPKTVGISSDNYEKVRRLANKLGFSIQKTINLLVEYAVDNVEIEEVQVMTNQLVFKRQEVGE